MNTKHKFATIVPEAKPLDTLANAAGIRGRWLVDAKTKKDATAALRELAKREIEGQMHVALHGLAVVEAQVATTLAIQMQRNMDVFTEEAAMEAGAMDATLSSQADAEIMTHIANRNETYRAIAGRVRDGEMSEEEAAAIRQMADGRLAQNIERTIKRHNISADIAANLHEYVTTAQRRAMDRVN